VRPRPLLAVVVLGAAALPGGCNQGSLPGGHGDAALADLWEPPGDDLSVPVEPLCGAKVGPRVSLNGVLDLAPAVSGHLLPLDCCEAAAIDLRSAALATTISITWRYQGGLIPDRDVTVDLASLPAPWQVLVAAGCDPWTSGCTPVETVGGGFTGWLTVGHAGGTSITSLCLDSVEDPAAPRALLHALHLWAPLVTAR
jgi:hypothetical protein